METTIEIRPAEPSDIDALVEFNTALARETESRQLDQTTVCLGVRSLLESPEAGFYIVAVDRRQVVGCAMVTFEWSDWRNGCFWWIQSVYVQAEYRRQGVFRQLYEYLIARAEQLPDVCGLRLYVEHENHAAHTTYRSMGMKATPYQLYEYEFE